MKPKRRIMVAMSGGVDSSVAAGLLVRRGYEVMGVTMQIWQESQTDPRHAGCCSLGAVEDARRVARALAIPYYVINFKQEFKRSVIDNFMDEYEQGRTPNPCIRCNRYVKFDALLHKASEVGCDILATGHYARIRRREGVFRLLRARAKDKDQSYALYSLSQEQLSRTMFPLGELPGKHETRQLAREMGLQLADKPDSQEICFVSEAGGYVEFMKNNRPRAFGEGNVVDESGRILGKHSGVGNYTIGQRRRVLPNSEGRPLYVLRLEPKENVVVVGPDQSLFRSEVLFHDEVGQIRKPLSVVGRIRYNMPPARATLYPGRPARAEFASAVRAVTPGQAAVFYKGETVVAGGTIL